MRKSIGLLSCLSLLVGCTVVPATRAPSAKATPEVASAKAAAPKTAVEVAVAAKPGAPALTTAKAGLTIRLPRQIAVELPSLLRGDASSILGQDGNSALGGDGSGVIAGGAGNIVAAGGGNVVAGGGGNLIGQDGSSVVAAGAGNVIAGGAGNYRVAETTETTETTQSDEVAPSESPAASPTPTASASTAYPRRGDRQPHYGPKEMQEVLRHDLGSLDMTVRLAQHYLERLGDGEIPVDVPFRVLATRKRDAELIGLITLLGGEGSGTTRLTLWNAGEDGAARPCAVLEFSSPRIGRMFLQSDLGQFMGFDLNLNMPIAMVLDFNLDRETTTSDVYYDIGMWGMKARSHYQMTSFKDQPDSLVRFLLQDALAIMSPELKATQRIACTAQVDAEGAAALIYGDDSGYGTARIPWLLDDRLTWDYLNEKPHLLYLDKDGKDLAPGTAPEALKKIAPSDEQLHPPVDEFPTDAVTYAGSLFAFPADVVLTRPTLPTPAPSPTPDATPATTESTAP